MGIKFQKGQTWIECLIVLTLNSFIVLMCLSVFLMIKTHYQRQLALSRIQENARITHRILAAVVKTNGSLGCEKLTASIALRTHPPYDQKLVKHPDAYQMGIDLVELKSKPFIPNKIFEKAVSESDIFWHQSVTKPVFAQIEPHKDQYVLKLSEPIRLKNNDPVVLSDCAQADLYEFKMESASGRTREINQIKVPLPIASHYPIDNHYPLWFGRFQSEFYYIGDTNRLNAAGEPICALYSFDRYGRDLERVEGVEKMSISYGIQNGQQMTYVPLKEIFDWDLVRSIKMRLQFSSIEPYANGKVLRQWWEYVFTC